MKNFANAMLLQAIDVNIWLYYVIFILFGFITNTVFTTKDDNSDIRCGDPPIPLNARVSLSLNSLTPGTIATYTCDEGYELFGNPSINCSPTGKWIGEIPFCGTNIAFRKPANQSTTVRGGNAINANDGDKTTVHDGKRCTETQKEASPWWTVDLLQPYSVKIVRVTTRGCCGHQPLRDLEIRVGNSSSELQRNPLCAWFPGTVDEGTTKTFTCARPLVGQYVFLQLVGIEGSLSLCEVEVFSTDELSNERCIPKNSEPDIQLAAFLHTCYEFKINRGGSFKDAREYCQKHSGDLMHEFSGPTSRFLITELERRKSQLKTQLVWIGAQKEPGITTRTWKWVNGNVILHPTWGKDQPNNYNGEQNCVVLDGGRNWLWNDVGCNLDYLHWICQHKPPVCGSPDKKLNTTIIGSNYTIGSIIEYRCPVGQFLQGSAKRSCQNDGFWSGSAPTCKYVDCGNVNEIEFGTILYGDNRTTYNATVQYKCHQNYTLIGNEKRTCTEEGKWSNSEPKCLFDWCPEPPQIQGGTVKVSGHQAGSVAVYECTAGSILIGNSTISCTLGGKWSNKPPVCKYVECGTPAGLNNGRYELLNGTTYGSVVRYTCNDDYWLDGQSIQKCTREGVWSANVPSCELITCDEPEVPPGSYVVGYDFNIHSSIEYHCEVGHILHGEATHVCTKEGVWTGRTPNCEFVDCGRLPPILYGTVNYTNGTTYVGSEITYSCVNNYRLVGNPKRYCQDNGQWSDSGPKCEEIRCPEPILAEHSILSVTGNDRMYGRTLIRTAESTNVGATSYKIGALVKYRCERGYKIVGEPLSTCEDNGQWSGTIPQCVFVDCKNPPRIKNGKYTLASNVTYYGATVLYECNPNYELDGVSRRLCVENGTWSSETPTCKEIKCTDPDTIGNVVYEVSTHSVGGIAHYTCPKGHNMSGNNTRVCLKRGAWSGTSPICTPVDCKDPGTIENGRVIIMNGTTYGSTIEYHCVPHFDRIGPYLRKCLENGVWSGEEPKCLLASTEPADSQGLGMTIGISCSVVVFLLLMLAIIYFRLRKAMPVKNTENIEGAERKEDQNAAVMSYATLNGNRRYTHTPIGSNVYDNIHEDNVYDAPYEETGRESGTYEPEPIMRNGNVTINGVAAR